MRAFVQCPEDLVVTPSARGRPAVYREENPRKPGIIVAVLFADIDLHDTLVERAEASRCSFSSYVRAVMEHYVDT